MKKLIVLFAFFVMPYVTGVSASNDEACITSGAELSIKEVCDFLKKCGHYFIATVDGDQPRVRPFGTAAIFENKLYIQTGKHKRVSKQLKANPKIEICAFDQAGGKWLRIEAVAVEDDRVEAKQFMLDEYPSLKKMYKADDGNTQVFYLKNATAFFSSFEGEPKTVKF
ncbi:MAG: pyridoxamine 5'-phosphate oxidase family protein [Bacteroidales bacterium]|jgi:uncharacterized pyridoxamine 5'-phosphate oxidase family protein|nr:pyridoxamine 5'-phosphate oxidase family protein [Bacteroidales bacterium]